MKTSFLLFALSIVLTNLCLISAQEKNQSGDTFTLDGYTFEAKEKDGKCVLDYRKGKLQKQLPLNIAAPCKAIRRDVTNAVKSFKYKDIKATVFMIAGKTGTDQRCKTQSASESQAILIKPKAVIAGKTHSGAFCLPEGLEEKDFWMLSH